MTNPTSPSTTKSSLLQELAASRKTLEEDNQQLRDQLEQANQIINQLQNEIAALHSKNHPTPRKNKKTKFAASNHAARMDESAASKAPTQSKPVNNHLWVVPGKENDPALS